MVGCSPGMDSVFKPGMLVAYGEIRRGVMTRVICIKAIKSVGKRDVKLEDSQSRFQLDGAESGNVYYGRGIQRLTKALYAQAEADRAIGLGLALGATLTD